METALNNVKMDFQYFSAMVMNISECFHVALLTTYGLGRAVGLRPIVACGTWDGGMNALPSYGS